MVGGSFVVWHAHAQIDPGIVFEVHHREPSWSRQGLVAYEDSGWICVNQWGGATRADSLRGLWVLNPATGERQRVLSWGWTPSWSPDGQKLAFGYGPRIFRLDLETGVVTRLTSTGQNYFPAWSPDGEWIVYQSDDRVALMRPDGSLNHVVGPEGCSYPSWSSDGKRILHYGPHGEGGALYSMDLNGEDPVLIFEVPVNELNWSYPQYSPDGSQIAIEHQLHEVPNDVLPEIWLLQADGTGLRRLTTGGGSHPSWSPDGTEIVFTRSNYYSNTPEDGVLWTIDPNTLVKRQITWKWPERCRTPVTETKWSDVKKRFR
jgi:TolB protein